MKNNKSYKTPYLGAAIKQIRKSKGWSQEDLAQVAKCSAPTIVHIEQGIRAPQYDTLVNLAKALNTPLETLIILEKKLQNDDVIRLTDIYAINVKTRRLKLNMTREDLASKARVSLSYVRNVELGKNSSTLDKLSQFAVALNTSPSQLIAQIEI